MKTFSLLWNKSTQTRKQRKFRFEAPYHVKRKFLNVHLSKELQKKYGRRSTGIRKNDTVKVLRGQYRGKTGLVNRVDMKNSKIYVDGAERVRREGSKTFYPLDPSNVMITELDTDDKKRVQSLQNAKKTS